MKTLGLLMLLLSLTAVLATCPAEFNIVQWEETEISGNPIILYCPNDPSSFLIRFCSDVGWSTISGSCPVSNCPSNTIDDRVWPETEPGQTATLSCPAGQTGSYSRLCSSSGNWESEVNNCVPITCPADGNWAQTNAGETASQSCPVGTVGEHTRLCNLDGTWAEAVNNCHLPMCPAETYEGIQYPETAPNTPAVVPCPAGQTGSYIRLCGATGVWSNPTSTCQAITCPADGDWPQTNAGETASQDCPVGTVGEHTRLCTLTGAWAEAVNNCHVPMCPAELYEGIQYPETAINTPAVVPCPAGQTGNYIRLCGVDGTWSNPTNNCQVLTCPADGDWSQTNAGETATLSCAEGQTGSRTRLCTLTGTWENEVNTCAALMCPAELYEGIQYPETTPNTPAVVPCPAGQSGNYIRLCGPTGVWSNPTNNCQVLTCPTNGDWSQTNAGETATLSCAEGQTGSRTRLCTLAGTWAEEVNTCAALMCPAETYEGIQYPETAPNTPAMVPCPPGQSGSYIRLCGATGVWSNPTNNCQVLTCPADGNWSQTNAGETATLSCPEGQAGSRTRLCTLAGTWAEEVSTCSEITCPAELYDGVQYPETPANSPASVPCPAGQSGSYIRFCGATGVWSNPTNNCQVLTCSSVEDPINGVTWPQTNAGATANATCAYDSSVITRPCTLEGTWGAISGSCPPLVCASVTEGGYVWPETPIGNNSTLPCAGLTTGTVSRTCNEGGLWGEILSACVPITCEPDVLDGYTFPLTPANTTAVINCAEGFYGNVTRFCSETGVWGSYTANCEPSVLSCPAESYQSYEWPLTPEGTLASLSCELGYAGAITRMCLVGGTWNATVDNTCTQLSCPLDGDWNVTVAGVNATLACAEGYSGSRTRFCSYSGVWEDENNECVQTMCLPTTISGFSFPAQEPNTTATLSCPLGFSGTVSYTCTEAMTWTDFVNNCVQEFCLATEEGGYEWPLTAAGQSVAFECGPGMSGTVHRNCTDNAVWEPIINDCQNLFCSNETVSGHMWDVTLANTTATLQCSDYNQYQIGVITRHCTIDSVWEDEVNNCVYIAPEFMEFVPAEYSYVINQNFIAIRPLLTPSTYIEECSSNPPLPQGLKLSSECVITGPATEITDTSSYIIIASNSGGTVYNNITFTFSTDVCPERNGYSNVVVGESLVTPCFFFGKESVDCVLSENRDEAVWGEVESNCTMMMIYEIAVLVVLVILIIAFICCCCCCCGGNKVTKYPKKKALAKSIELIGV